jgi:diadenosine tetraphosphatase ApaH/serine/threonine PP2A family protein phosphatase
MRSAVISDIHGNLVALNAVLSAAADLSVDRILCLGDIVGYNPWPNECVDLMRERSIVSVMGNHDRVAAGIGEPDDFNEAARDAILWTRERLSRENREFLARLPERVFIGESIVLVHGSPRDPNEYILSTGAAERNIHFMRERLGTTVAFFGHTHVAGLFAADRGGIGAFGPRNVKIDGGRAYLINPGSVGQPRDGDPRAAFLIYDYEAGTVRFERVDYDVEAVFGAVVEAGLPAHLGRRLFLGR